MHYVYTSQVFLRKDSERLSLLFKRNHVSIWNWIQKYKPQKMQSRRRKVLEYIIDEAMLRVGSEYIWLWVAIEPRNKQILAQNITQERNIFVAERFIGGLVKFNGKHPVSMMVLHVTQWLVSF